MTRDEAIVFCKDLHKSGLPVDEILKKLTDSGYVGVTGRNVGKPLASRSSIYNLLNEATPKARDQRPLIKMETLTDTPNLDKLAAVRKLINAHGLSDSDKLALIKAMIQ